MFHPNAIPNLGYSAGLRTGVWMVLLSNSLDKLGEENRKRMENRNCDTIYKTWGSSHNFRVTGILPGRWGSVILRFSIKAVPHRLP